MYYHCGVPLQAISEYTMAEYSRQAKLIIVPSPRVLTEKCWTALEAEANRGATLAISGAIDADEHGRFVYRLLGMGAKAAPVTQSEAINIGRQYLVRYDGEKMQRIEKAVVGSKPTEPVVLMFGSGRIVWSPLPLEVGDSMAALAAFYKFALEQTRITPAFTATPRTPGVLILPSVFRDVVLYTFVSETNRDTPMTVTHLESRTRFNVLVPAGRTAMVLIDRRNGRVLGRM
jgi:hypothetical protein